MTENAKDRTFETAELPEYRVEAYVAEIPVPEYMVSCVDIPTFLGYCEACPSYGKTWAFGLLRGLPKLWKNLGLSAF